MRWSGMSIQGQERIWRWWANCGGGGGGGGGRRGAAGAAGRPWGVIIAFGSREVSDGVCRHCLSLSGRMEGRVTGRWMGESRSNS